MRRVLAALGGLAVGVAALVGVSNADPSPTINDVHFDAATPAHIFVGETQVWPTTQPPASTTTDAPTTTVLPTTTSSVAPTTAAPSTTAATTVPATTTTPLTTSTTVSSTGGQACGSAGVVFCESFSDPAAFTTRFDHGWAGEIHAGSVFGEDKNGWPGDHDMTCGNPNMTYRSIDLGPGAFGETAPASSSDPAFYPCLPGGNPASGHLMTSANTEGYVIAWFSPKGYFNDVRKVCFDNNLNYIGNGIWFQLEFLTPAEASRKPVIDGVTYDVMDLGFTSPDFPNNGGVSTPQGTASAGVKFLVGGHDNAADARLLLRSWVNGAFPGGASGVDAGPATTDKAPRYQICTTDNGNGTLTITNASPDGTVHTNTLVGAIPDGPVRVVLEHDEYNPDKHHDGNGGVGTNEGEGYTYHWDNVQVYG